jgi:transposase InsO family protein
LFLGYIFEIFNTDQGSQFDSEIFTKQLLDKAIQISMDGKGRAIDNIFIERLWRSVKYEHIYLHVAEDGVELYEGLNIFPFIITCAPISHWDMKHQQAVI